MDAEQDRPRWRATLSRRLLPTLQAGVEYNPVVGEVGPIATWFLLTEDESRPALYLGTSSDRIGSPEGAQAYYLTCARRIGGTPVAPYASVNYSEWDERLNFPFGAHVELAGGFSLQPMYDGNRTHLLGIYSSGRWSVTGIWAWLERAGIAVAVGFDRP